MLIKKLLSVELNKVKEAQQRLTQLLGASVKIGYFSTPDTSCDWSINHESTVSVQHKMTLLMFLMSKDDSLLCLTGGLIYSILGARECIAEGAREGAKELFGERKDEEETKEEVMMNPM